MNGFLRLFVLLVVLLVTVAVSSEALAQFPPTGVSASDGTYTDKVAITWNPVSGAYLYAVYRAESSGGTKTAVGGDGRTSYDDTSATPGTMYWYWVRAVSTSGVSGYSSYNTGWRDVAAPTGVSASDGTYTDKVRITWNSVPDVSDYQVYRATPSSPEEKTALGSWQTGTSYDDTSATPGTTYYYWVMGGNPIPGGHIISDYSSPDTGRRNVAAPTGVLASDGTYTDKVRITWNSVPDVSRYLVSRADSLDGTKTILSGLQPETSYDDTSAAPGTTYYYWVRGANLLYGGYTVSDYSSLNTGWRKLLAPTGVSASDGTYTDKVGITWKGVSGASYYRVYRAISPKGIRIAIGLWQTGRSYNDTSTTPGTTYYYWVTAATNSRGFGASDSSSYDSGWRKLAAPTGVSASDGTYTDKVGITWNSVTGASYYRVWRATSLGGAKTALGSWQSGKSYNDISATPGMTYYYWVRAATSSRGDRGSDYSFYDTGWQARSSGGPLGYVDVAAMGTNDGTSWTNAYNRLQNALANVGVGDEIWVAEGTYRPDEGSGVTSGDREATFELRNDVVIYGGFPSGGGDWEDRNPDGYQTILSGDLSSDDGADFANNGENSYHVVTGSFSDGTAILDGFTITAGNANAAGMPHDAGGGMRNESGNPTVRNCTFRGNFAIWGGGIENFDASPVIVSCTFSENSAGNGGGINNFNSQMLLTDCTFSVNSASRGGAMYSRVNSSLTITNCAFSANSAGIHGGGMYNIADSNPSITDCTFTENTAVVYGGGMLNAENSSPILTDCTFSENSADDGGGMYNDASSPTVTGCTFSGNSAKFGGGMSNAANSDPTITDCTFAGNTVDYDTAEHGSGGGGMYNNSSSPRVTGCTFSGNRANSGGGMSNTTNSSPTITDCTFADNTVEYADWLGSYGGGMFNGRNCSPIVTNCTFSGNSADGGGGMSNWNQSGVTVTGCTFMGNSSASSGGGMVSFGCTLTVTNCTFSGNSSGNSGGGMSNGYCSPTVTGCTFTGNSADRGGGMSSYSLTQNCSPIVSNCILWGNTANSEGNEIYNQGTNITPMISYCDIAGCLAGGAWDTSLGTDGGGNIDDDPLFVDADGADDTAGTEDDNLRLPAHSPCIDIGDNTAVTEAVDLDGRQRIVDGDDDGTATVDMGAYEYEPVVIYVDAAAAVGGNGDSWSNAFADLQEALAAAAGDPDQIWVAAGTYYPTTEVGGIGDRYWTFQLINGVVIYGGFAGTETALAERDVQNNVTILSGNIGFRVDTDNSYHVVTGSFTDATAILDGFTITAGNANASGMPHDAGGGMRNESGSPTVRNCTFSGNSAEVGGGMYNNTGSPTVTDCTFSDNLADIGGGGMSNVESSPMVTDCTFSENSGGGMANDSSNPIVTRCTFSGNSADMSLGGGMYNQASSPSLLDCTFSGNSAEGGGGMFNIESSPTVTNCTFSGNSASTRGGGMYNDAGSLTVSNCTFSGNSAISSYGGGMYNCCESNVTVANCILWGNTAMGIGGHNPAAQIYSVNSTTAISYSCGEGWSGPGNPGAGVGNIDDDPLFEDADGDDDTPGTEDDNLHLSEGSPCIDAGDNTVVPAGVETDLDGHWRNIDGDCDGSAIVDMGAYEFDYAYMGDFDYNCEVNFSDFAVLAESWELDDPAIDIAPFGNPDGIIDFEELLVIADHWLEGVLP